MTTSSEPDSRPIIVIGILAALVAGVAVAYGDRSAALWAAASLAGAAGWLVVAGFRRLRQG